MLATEFRKNLYQNLDQAAKREPLTIEYRGITLRLQAVNGSSRLSRAIRRNPIIGERSSNRILNSWRSSKPSGLRMISIFDALPIETPTLPYGSLRERLKT